MGNGFFLHVALIASRARLGGEQRNSFIMLGKHSLPAYSSHSLLHGCSCKYGLDTQDYFLDGVLLVFRWRLCLSRQIMSASHGLLWRMSIWKNPKHHSLLS